MPPARGYWDQMMETDILSKNDTYHAINPAYPDTCCIHHLRYRSTYPYPLSSVVLELFFFQNLYLSSFNLRASDTRNPQQ